MLSNNELMAGRARCDWVELVWSPARKASRFDVAIGGYKQVGQRHIASITTVTVSHSKKLEFYRRGIHNIGLTPSTSVRPNAANSPIQPQATTRIRRSLYHSRAGPQTDPYIWYASDSHRAAPPMCLPWTPHDNLKLLLPCEGGTDDEGKANSQ